MTNILHHPGYAHLSYRARKAINDRLASVDYDPLILEPLMQAIGKLKGKELRPRLMAMEYGEVVSYCLEWAIKDTWRVLRMPWH